MLKFRKKPVVIEAMRFTDLDSYLAIVEWMKASGDTHALAEEVRFTTPIMLLQTLEGTMAANPGDYIIRGVQGEFYPCKPDIFEQTYEPVEPQPDAEPVPEGMVRLTLRVTEASTTVDVDQAEYEQAKDDGEVDEMLDAYFSDLDGDNVVVEPDGREYKPFDQPHGPVAAL